MLKNIKINETALGSMAMSPREVLLLDCRNYEGISNGSKVLQIHTRRANAEERKTLLRKGEIKWFDRNVYRIDIIEQGGGRPGPFLHKFILLGAGETPDARFVEKEVKRVYESSWPFNLLRRCAYEKSSLKQLIERKTQQASRHRER